jgi:dienelactone hydrolase
MPTARAIACILVLLSAIICTREGRAGDTATNASIDTAFADYSPLSSNAELARRLLSPLTAAQLPQILARTGKAMRPQPVDLADEEFVLHVPLQVPSGGYALLVFVPPWNAAKLPVGWAPVLDRYGAIFVSAAHSGNDESVLGRRVPLALLAEQNVVKRYPVNPNRIFVAGFSGGSRVALRLALGYPDIFRGVVLNAGSDRIGTAEIPLPPTDLFRQFQDSTRIVYVTGDRDIFSAALDAGSMRAMQYWCVANLDSRAAPFADHEVVQPAALSEVFDILFAPARPVPVKLAACMASLQADLTAKLQQASAEIASGDRDSASQLLKEIDQHFGGLAAPRSVELAMPLSLQK